DVRPAKLAQLLRRLDLEGLDRRLHRQASVFGPPLRRLTDYAQHTVVFVHLPATVHLTFDLHARAFDEVALGIADVDNLDGRPGGHVLAPLRSCDVHALGRDRDAAAAPALIAILVEKLVGLLDLAWIADAQRSDRGARLLRAAPAIAVFVADHVQDVADHARVA